MPLFAVEGRAPEVSPGAWIAPTATLVGAVTVEEDASVWYGAVLRGDFQPVANGALVLDGAVVGARTLRPVQRAGGQPLVGFTTRALPPPRRTGSATAWSRP
jgi:carbonic anhydrase/acetyltransferase-like protein (isoleucine patch superfamily)